MLEWKGEREFRIGDTSYVTFGPESRKLTSHPDRFRIFKARLIVERYAALAAELAPRRIFELGIFDGGSTAFLAQLIRPEKLVAVDLTPEPCEALEQFIDSHGLRSTVVTHYGVDQGDAMRLRRILHDDFADASLDLVIDDASHRVDPTRASFNCLFPHLRPGGVYLIEDWNWADTLKIVPTRLRDSAPLSIFVYELLHACAKRPAEIARVEVTTGWALVHRGPAPLDPSAYDVGTSYGEHARALLEDLRRPYATS